MRENEITDSMAHRLETMMKRGGIFYEGASFNASLYYGCHSHETPNEFNKDYIKLTLCENSPIAGLSTQAIFQTLPSPSHCDTTMPDITLRQQSFIPITFSTSIFSQCAFYFLPLVEVAVGHSQYEKYSCVVQHLLKHTNCRVAVHWSDAIVKYENASSLHEKCSKIVESLPFCESSMNSSKCIYKSLKLVFQDDFKIKLEKWIDFLEKMNSKQTRQTKQDEICSKIIWYPKSYSDNRNFQNFKSIDTLYNKTCFKNNSKNYKKIDLTKTWFKKPNILLLVIFNNLFTDVIPYVELQYRPFYPNIIYCAPSLSKVEDLKTVKVNFMSYKQHHVAGCLNYYCFLKVIKMGLKIDGIISIADDVFLKTDIVNYPLDKIWFQPLEKFRLKDMDKMKDCTNFTCKNCTYFPCDSTRPWMWWTIFRKKISSFFTEIDQQSDSDLKMMRNRLKFVTKGEHRLFGAISDALYLPKSYFTNFTKIVSLLAKNHVFLEIAIPTALMSMEDSDKRQSLNGYYSWTAARMKPWTFMKQSVLKDAVTVHPVKLKTVIQGLPVAVDMFCNCMLPYFHDPNQKLCN